MKRSKKKRFMRHKELRLIVNPFIARRFIDKPARQGDYDPERDFNYYEGAAIEKTEHSSFGMDRYVTEVVMGNYAPLRVEVREEDVPKLHPGVGVIARWDTRSRCGLPLIVYVLDESETERFIQCDQEIWDKVMHSY